MRMSEDTISCFYARNGNVLVVNIEFILKYYRVHYQ